MSPGVVLTTHSYKGGTGKSLISTNLASIFARQGKNVCLVDLDLRAPTLDSTFAAKEKYKVNDFLNGKCQVTDLLNNVSKEVGAKGKLFVALADSSMEGIREIIIKDRRWELRALRRLISLKEHLIEKLGMDYVIFDTSPGLSYSSINAIAVSDMVVVVTIWDASDIAGTRGMVGELYDLLDKRAMVLMNKVPQQMLPRGSGKNLIEEFKLTFKLPVMDLLPCYCDVMRMERADIISLKEPEHPFSKGLVKVSDIIDKKAEEIKPLIPPPPS